MLQKMKEDLFRTPFRFSLANFLSFPKLQLIYYSFLLFFNESSHRLDLCFISDVK